jgi:hypothetical protein
LTEREAADIRLVMSQAGTPIAGKVVALLDRVFPNLRQRAAEHRERTPAPKVARTMVDAIIEQRHPTRKNAPSRSTGIAFLPTDPQAHTTAAGRGRVPAMPSMTDAIKANRRK